MRFPEIERIAIDPAVMGGKPCLRGMRITVGTVAGLAASVTSFDEILKLYPYLEEEDIRENAVGTILTPESEGC
jgi:uncharacterized protein (DUF433 family)